MHDCGFTHENNWFRYRAAALIIENDCLLFVGNEKENYYYSVGGGVHMGETAKDAVIREVYEETGVNYEIDRLAIIHENFFNQHSGGLKGLNCHEICFYFLMKSKGSQKLKNKMTQDSKEELYWLPINKLDKYNTFPKFFKDYFHKNHSEVVHIITDDRK